MVSAGKTVSSKILMAHLATFHESKGAYVTQEVDDTLKENIVKIKETDEVLHKQPLSFLRQSLDFVLSLFYNTSDHTNEQDLTTCESNSKSFDDSLYQPVEVEPEGKK